MRGLILFVSSPTGTMTGYWGGEVPIMPMGYLSGEGGLLNGEENKEICVWNLSRVVFWRLGSTAPHSKPRTTVVHVAQGETMEKPGGKVGVGDAETLLRSCRESGGSGAGDVKATQSARLCPSAWATGMQESWCSCQTGGAPPFGTSGGKEPHPAALTSTRRTQHRNT